MPPLPGEERILTVFADVHYYFSAPTRRPHRDRFDKGSYLYVYHNATHHKARIEIANNPGTPDQDAFHGALDPLHLRHSTRFPTLCTLTVDGQALSSNNFRPPSNADPYEWRLPTGDPRDEGNELHLLHTLDIYFWNLDDANSFLDSVERGLSQNHIETDRHNVPSKPDNTMSNVVRQLEDVAVTDPAYQNGRTRNSRAEPVCNVAPELQNVAATSTLPPPPPGGPPPTAQPATGARQPTEEQQDVTNFTPLPYNPAAPAAPEPIQHREKTPPPVDGGGGTGLADAAAADSGAQYAQQIPGSTSFAPPPTQPVQYTSSGTAPGGYASPPPSAGLTHSASVASRSSIHSNSGVASYQSPFASGVGAQVSQPGPMAFAPPPKDRNANPYGQHIYVQPHPNTGYSNFTYEQQAPPPHAVTSEYGIHSQAYRPTQAEANSHYQKYAKEAMKNRGQRPHKLEDGAARVENSVNKFLRKLEKGI